jgi:hypothetical protein
VDLWECTRTKRGRTQFPVRLEKMEGGRNEGKKDGKRRERLLIVDCVDLWEYTRTKIGKTQFPVRLERMERMEGGRQKERLGVITADC